jgi:ABC-2 type transport system permease protein
MNKTRKYHQLWQLITAQFKEITREPGVLFWGIIFPILMSLGLGIAFTKKADVTRKVAVVDPFEETKITADSSSDHLAGFLEKYGSIEEPASKDTYSWKITLPDDKLGNSIFLFYKHTWTDAMLQLKRGSVNIVLLEKDGHIEYHFDPVNSDAQLTYLKLSGLIENHKSIASGTNVSIKPLTVTGTRYIDFLIPGLIGMGVMMSTLWGLSYGIIEKRSKKLLRRMVATPMKKHYFLMALIAVRFAMNLIESLLLLIFAIIVFHLKIQGSFTALLAIFFAGNVAFAGMSVFVSSHTSNTEVGNGLINAIVMPMMVLSGIFFSYHNFPDWSIPVIQKLPLTMLTDGMRSIINEGAGYPEIAFPFLILMAIGALFFTAGLKVFKWY